VVAVVALLLQQQKLAEHMAAAVQVGFQVV
jgi:hypothetical protein